MGLIDDITIKQNFGGPVSSSLAFPEEWRIVLNLVQSKAPDAVLAGGAVRDTLLGQSVKDLDIFLEWSAVRQNIDSDWEDLLGGKQTFRKDCQNIYQNLRHYCKGICTIDRIPGLNVPVQLLLMGSLADLKVARYIEKFDWGLCMADWDGTTVHKHPMFEHDAVGDTLTFNPNSMNTVRSGLNHAHRILQKYPDRKVVLPAEVIKSSRN